MVRKQQGRALPVVRARREQQNRDSPQANHLRQPALIHSLRESLIIYDIFCKGGRVFCTDCGYENPAVHRFCGMCGTPLPQSSTTAPDVPVAADVAGPTSEPRQARPSSVVSRSAPSASPGIQTSRTQPSEIDEPNYFSQAEKAESIEQFIAGFHYTPPAEEDEVTMTGDKPELDIASAYEPAVPVSMSEETTTAVNEPAPRVEEPVAPQALPVEQAPLVETAALEPPPFATKGTREEAPERSGFLDFSEPEKPPSPATPPASVGGPSFLGLSDAPATPAHVSDESDLVTPPSSHWRAWTVAIVVCIFAGLAILEWRAEQRHSNIGPIGIMKMQIERLKGKRAGVIPTTPPSEATPESVQPGSTVPPNGSGPEMRTAPQPKPQTNAPQPNGNTTLEKPANPGAASNSPTPLATTTSAAKSGTSGNAQAPSQKPQTESAEGNNAEAANSPESPGSKTDKAAKTATPGAEELAKASTASDAAAASAWLWKAVAKGNPEAPIKLANMYIKGDGVPQSCDQAMVLLRSAAAKENAAARSRLGALYATGTCVPRNRVRAYQYMSQALEANPGAVWPRDFRQQLWSQMTPQERQQAQAAQ